MSCVVTRAARDIPQLPAVHATLEETEAGLPAPQTRLLGTACRLVTHVSTHVAPEILFRFWTLPKKISQSNFIIFDGEILTWRAKWPIWLQLLHLLLVKYRDLWGPEMGETI